MPLEYLKCVENKIKKGKSKKEAQKICAIAFYKRHGITPQQAEKGNFDMTPFSEHKFIKNTDGSYNILEVPIFELGKHKNFTYDENWASDALGNFNALKEKKFLPRVIIGHTNDQSEKPAIGFLDNLKLTGKIIKADLTNLAEKTFNEIKNKAWPGRSVEVNPNKKKFTALALLGGTEPHFQFEPIDVNFQADPDGEWISFESGDEKNVYKIFFDKLLEMFKSSTNNGDEKMTAEEKTQLTADIKQALEADFEKKFEERYNAKFKEDFGVEPDEYKKNLEKDEQKKFEESKKSTLDKIRKMIVPAVVDGYMAPIIENFSGIEGDVIKFADKEEGSIFDLMIKFAEAVAKRAQKNTLIVDMDERARFSDEDEGNPNFNRKGKIKYLDMTGDERVKLDQQVAKYMKTNKIETFEEALEMYLEENDL